jgi:hypothetical protein
MAMRGEAGTFPVSYATLETSVLLDAYGRGPARLRETLEGLAASEIRARPVPGKWSIIEIAVHVADSELVGAVRMRMVLGGEAPLLPAYDQDRWSRALKYAEADAVRLERVLALFDGLRASTLGLLTAATAADWIRLGVHPEHGPLTLRNLLELYADHSERHLAQIAERRALLGLPIDLPALLPRRLY